MRMKCFTDIEVNIPNLFDANDVMNYIEFNLSYDGWNDIIITHERLERITQRYTVGKNILFGFSRIV